jgi:hypothetical protein
MNDADTAQHRKPMAKTEKEYDRARMKEAMLTPKEPMMREYFLPHLSATTPVGISVRAVTM